MLLYRRPAFAMRSIVGVGMTPPKVLGTPKPESSVMMSKMLGACLAGTTRGAHHGLDWRASFLITPPNFGSGGGSCFPLMVVVAHLLIGSRLLFGGHLFGADLHRQLVKFTSKRERDLVVFLIHRSACINADAERLTPGKAAAETVRHWMAVRSLAVHLECAGTALAQPRTVILPVELKRVFAGRKRVLALPLHHFELDQVPSEDRLALQQIEAVAAEVTAIGDQHAFRAAFRNLNVRRDGVRPVQQIRRAGGAWKRHVAQLA